MIKGNSIELSRLEQVQKVLDINILEDSQIDKHVKLEQARLSSRPLNFDWTTKCPYVTVNGYYFVRYFCRPYDQRLRTEGNFYADITKKRNEKGKYEIDPFEEDAYRFHLLIEYANKQILGTDPDELDDELETDFFEEKNVDYFPTTYNDNKWVWVINLEEDIVEERMRDYCVSDGMADYFNGFEEEITLEKLVEALRAKLKEWSELHAKGIANAELEQEVEYLSSRRDWEEHVLHRQFNKELDGAMAGFYLAGVDAINEYCKKKARQARRKTTSHLSFVI